jgi:hypothetical protein
MTNKLLETIKNTSGASIDECIDMHFNAHLEAINDQLGKPIDVESHMDWLRDLYGGTPVPEIIIARDPAEALRIANRDGKRVQSTTGIGVRRLYHPLWYAAGFRMADPPEIHDVLMQEIAWATQVWDCVLCVEAAILIEYPTELHRDERHMLHRDGAPALVWSTGYAQFYHHSRRAPRWAYECPTAERIRSVVDAEERRMIHEIIGHDAVVDMLHLEAVDMDEIDGLHYTLYAGDAGGDPKWLRMLSPRLKDGSQPTYTEPVHEDCESCEEALGYRVTGELGESVRYEHQA